MLTVVIGGSGSGKSAYAESLLEAYQENKYYIATMQVYDPEGAKKVARHRELRAGKGFVTIEQPREIGRAADQIRMMEQSQETMQQWTKKFDTHGNATRGCALLECMSNLVANEMFDLAQGNADDADSNTQSCMSDSACSNGLPDYVKREPASAVVEKITADVLALSRKLDELVIVTNNVFEDGIAYDESTMEYLRVLGTVNRNLCKHADRVVEVVVGIPLVIKGEKQKCPL